MICPVCKQEGKESRVTPGGARRTLMGWSPGYYDERGNWVPQRDPNWTTTDYSCSNGHRFDVVTREGDPPRYRVAGAGTGCTYEAPDDAIYNGGTVTTPKKQVAPFRAEPELPPQTGRE